MPFFPVLLALLLTLLPWPARAQSIFNNAGPTAPGQPTTSPPVRDKPTAAPAGPTATPGRPAASGSQPSQAPLPPGSVIAPPGSLVLPPSSVRPPANRSRDTRRMNAATRCNQRQIACNQTCNTRTMGGAPQLCYKQCYAKFLHCINRLHALP